MRRSPYLVPCSLPSNQLSFSSIRPHLLTTGARRQDLFGVAQPGAVEQDVSALRHQRNGSIPIHLGFASSWADRDVLSGGIRPADLLSRWHLTLEMFGRLFAEEVGAEPRSTILELGGFPVKESRFKCVVCVHEPQCLVGPPDCPSLFPQERNGTPEKPIAT